MTNPHQCGKKSSSGYTHVYYADILITSIPKAAICLTYTSTLLYSHRLHTYHCVYAIYLTWYNKWPTHSRCYCLYFLSHLTDYKTCSTWWSSLVSMVIKPRIMVEFKIPIGWMGCVQIEKFCTRPESWDTPDTALVVKSLSMSMVHEYQAPSLYFLN